MRASRGVDSRRRGLGGGVRQNRVVDGSGAGRIKESHLGQRVLNRSVGSDIAVNTVKSAFVKGERGLVVLGIG